MNYQARQYNWTHITGAASTTVVFTGSGTLGSVVINNVGTRGTITLTDLGSPSATIGIITLQQSTYVTLPYDLAISNGLQVVTSASPDITVTWAK